MLLDSMPWKLRHKLYEKGTNSDFCNVMSVVYLKYIGG